MLFLFQIELISSVWSLHLSVHVNITLGTWGTDSLVYQFKKLEIFRMFSTVNCSYAANSPVSAHEREQKQTGNSALKPTDMTVN